MANVLFVCLHNAGRSQISQALFERAAAGRHVVDSAGTEPAEQIHSQVAEAMWELGIDLQERRPKRLEREQSLDLANERKATVVGHVQPLVAIRDHRVRALDAVGHVAGSRRKPREKAECAIDMQPRPVAVRELGAIGQRVEVSGVHLTSVGDHDRWLTSPGELALQRGKVEPPDRIGCQTANAAPTKAKHSDRLDCARMQIAARDDQRRRLVH
jgi:hypothetical protein